MPSNASSKIAKIGILLLPMMAIATSFAQEDPKDLIAVQVRSQGHECTTPISAEAEPAQSSPDERVWILVCDNATYRVKLIPDMAADIERLD